MAYDDFRAQAAMVDHVEALARLNDCGVADIVRTAVHAFLQENPVTNRENIHDYTIHYQSHSQPPRSRDARR